MTVGHVGQTRGQPAQLVHQVLGTNACQKQLSETRQPPSPGNRNSESRHNLGIGCIAARIGKEGPLLHDLEHHENLRSESSRFYAFDERIVVTNRHRATFLIRR